jgi:hypothetical protein
MATLQDWSTEDELRFIAKLGTHSTHGPTLDRAVWIQQYLKALPLRKNWGAMDARRVRAAAVQAATP